MTLDQLRIFVAVAERQHMTAAARALNLTQSAASAAIAALEERHAVKLFHRVGRGIALTDAGRMFLDQARAVLTQADAAAAMLDDFGTLTRGTLRIVASQTIASYWLPPLLATYADRHPSVGIDLAIANSEQAARQVREGVADLGFVEGWIDDPALARWPVGEDRLVLVAAHPPPVAPDRDWLIQARWIMREEGSGTRSSLTDALRRLDIGPDDVTIALVLPSNESIRTAVAAGAGIAALSALVVAPAMAAGRLHALPVDLGRRPFYALRHKERYRSRAADALLDLIAGAAVAGN